ncbi:hypothetical protein ES332_D12G031500v1 [Gossypium tomentosum]|uniref:CCHC-type domain-containing protein n=1 Tax=Gossypium tomentosum TaxID=34277 RepID=A0A5D2I418_GOSTO|nr:hypothetical protein ES332_D12G031500v1 [Gossypium tomentosum]
MVHLIARTRIANSQQVKGKKFDTKGNNYICTHCGEEGHSKQRCYEIIGYPEWWDFTKKPRKKIGQVVVTTTTDKEVSISTSNTITAHVAKAKNLGLSNTYLAMNGIWIIDTGATDHMINNSTYFSSICSSTKPHILTANGGVAPITGEGSIHVSNSINLDIVFLLFLSIFYLVAKSQNF